MKKIISVVLMLALLCSTVSATSRLSREEIIAYLEMVVIDMSAYSPELTGSVALSVDTMTDTQLDKLVDYISENGIASFEQLLLDNIYFPKFAEERNRASGTVSTTLREGSQLIHHINEEEVEWYNRYGNMISNALYCEELYLWVEVFDNLIADAWYGGFFMTSQPSYVSWNVTDHSESIGSSYASMDVEYDAIYSLYIEEIDSDVPFSTPKTASLTVYHF